MGLPLDRWMVYLMENPIINMDDDWGYPPFEKTPSSMLKWM